MRAELTALTLTAINMVIPIHASALAIEGMPEEYTAIMTAVNRLAASNALGSRRRPPQHSRVEAT